MSEARRSLVSTSTPRSGLLVLISAALMAFSAGGGESPLQVSPGTVVRWPGEGTERCGMEGSDWPALAEGCWFPIDLLHAPGPVRLSRWRDGVRERVTVQVGDYPYPVQEIEIADDSQIHLSAQDLARYRREQAVVGRLWSLRGPPRFTLPLSPPLEPLPGGGRFGSRRIFNGEPRSPHSGADYSAAAGTPVRAVADGRVALAAEHFFAGQSVYLDHGDGLVSMYFHLSEIAVEEGQEVRRGQRLGAVGASGRATGPHLHFGLRWRGARIDPGLLLGDPAQVPRVTAP